jgi:hypothetical protein
MNRMIREPTASGCAGEPVLLVIKDENLGPVQFAEKLYKKAAKHRRAIDQLQPLLDEAHTLLEYVADVEDNISQLDRCGSHTFVQSFLLCTYVLRFACCTPSRLPPYLLHAAVEVTLHSDILCTYQTFTRVCRMEDIRDLRALQEIQDEMVEQGLVKAPADAEMAMRSKAKAQKQLKRKRNPAPGGSDSPYRVYESPSGFQILIGRNHAQNDAISTRIAQGEFQHVVCIGFALYWTSAR